MKKKQIKFLTYKRLREMVKKNNLNYLLLVGQRSNGKSFAVKEECLRHYLETGKEFFYIRRYDDDIKDFLVEQYLSDLEVLVDQDTGEVIRRPIYELTNGNYDTISVFRKNIYLARTDENGKIVRGDKIGHVWSVNKEERLKSQIFNNVDRIIFEEFITSGSYILNEPVRFASLISTILRLRQGVIYMVGNTLSRIVPYYSAWNLQGTSKQKQGSMQCYEFKSGDSMVRVGVYLCEELNVKSSMYLGSAEASITKGYYHADYQSKLEMPIEDYEVIYSVVFIFDNHGFLMQLLRAKYEESYYTWYVQPKNTPPQKGSRIITDTYSANPMVSHTFRDALSKEEAVAFDLLRLKKVAFSDDLTGTEFKQCYQMLEHMPL